MTSILYLVGLLAQDIIDGKLDKRRKGIFGPPFGTKCVIFVDDLNMPALEVYGAQPPIEILRQWMDHGGWYDREDLSFRQLVDIQFVAAMGPPGGGRNHITPRYMRHFNVLCILDFNDFTLSTIFNVIMGWWSRKSHLSPDLTSMLNTIVAATIDIYRSIQHELLPTPPKSHYTYNMRDVAKVFQGVCMIGVSLEDMKSLVRLWSHECFRVFYDRLINDEDREWFVGYIKSRIEERIGLKCESIFQGKEPREALKNLAFGDVMDVNNYPKRYEEITDQKKLLTFMEESLGEYNAQTRSPLNLVLFTYAAQHILRISRIIRQPYGNALLVGVGGVGRQSLTKLATFLAGYYIFQIQISKLYGVMEWQEDLKSVLRKSGGENNPTVFLFSDTQLKEERFLEDINNILNTGEVPNLYPKDEIIQVYDLVRNRAKKAGKDGSNAELYMFFVEQCRFNLHMVICMSPFGSSFRTRLRMFPSLVNCCTIDWFTEWPAEALKSVGTKFLSVIKVDEDHILPGVIDMCMSFHQDARNLASAFLTEQGRYFYVTPTSFLELLNTYKGLLEQKRLQVNNLRMRYVVGLEKLFEAEGQVNVMKKELEALQPVLLKTAEETNELLHIIDRDRNEAEKTRLLVEEEEAVANIKAEESRAIKTDCESELAVAMPMLEAALSALDTLTKADITEVKAMKNPPGPVKMVMEAVCLMKQVKFRRIPDPNSPGKKMDDYWGPAQQMLADTGFLPSLREYDKDNIPQPIIDKIRPYLAKTEFDPEVVKKASKAAYGLCCWVRAMESYDRVAKVVAPKRAKLEAANAEFEQLQIALNKKKEILRSVQEKLATLQQQLDTMESKKAQLEHEVDNCQKKLYRAEKLIGGLGGEKVRWTNVAEELAKLYRCLTGDVLLASGYAAYLGVVTISYRERLVRQWGEMCKSKNIPSSATFKLASVLGNPVTIRDWVIDGLPNDSFSIDSAIIIQSAKRWPLLIDPQGQANKWIKAKEKAKNLQIAKLSDSDFVRKLENCITFGYPLLLENVGEELDPTLEPVLSRSVFKQAGSLQIRIGDNTLEYNESFRLYITTKLRNPHYMPEVSVKVTLLNFMITPEGLTDQILGMVVKNERPDLEEEKTQLVLQGAENQRQLKDIEDRIIEGLDKQFAEDPGKWKHIYDSPQPYSETLPGELDTKLNMFQKLLIVRIIRPDKMVSSINMFVLVSMGQRYVEPPGFDLESAYRDSSQISPLIFVLSPGSDPMSSLLKFAEVGRHEVQSISLGQGQGPKAAALIQTATQIGLWVVLQNCHLAASWMPHLERICEVMNMDNTNAGFRLWLTSYPSDQFPVAILQSGIKMTNESPKGLRANMLQSYQSYPINDPKFFNFSGEKGPTWRKMLFGLCLFHASVQERVKFGPLGWNIPYQFSDPDLKISMRQLQSFLLEYPESVPFKALIYVTGECNYGGRVTDALDRRTLMCLLSTIYNPKILDDSYKFSPSGIYYAPPDGEYQDYIEHIKQFPLISSPEVFGLHENADITKDQQETDLLLSSLLVTQSSTRSVGGQSRDEVLLKIAKDIADRIPQPFDIELARFRHPVRYEESMNSVLHQEMARYNGLIEVIRSTLNTLQRTLKGLVAMSSETEKLANSMYLSKIPAVWAAKSYPSLKPLPGYVADLLERLRMLQRWFEQGRPPQFWISGFFFTHAFLTGVLQNYARKYKIPIDNVGFEFKCLPKDVGKDEQPEDGVYVYGMFLEGAKWDFDKMKLTESLPKVLYYTAPNLWLSPCELSKKKSFPCYHCPLFRTAERRGVLATTGHSSNFVFNVELPTDMPEEHWVRRGVALLLQLSD